MTAKKKEQKWHGPCIYKVREVESPHGKVFRGFRFVVAVPNMNGHKPFSNLPAASFARSYMLFQSSDWTLGEVEKQTKGAIQFLLNRGFNTVESSEVYEARMLEQMSKGRINHVEYQET